METKQRSDRSDQRPSDKQCVKILQNQCRFPSLVKTYLQNRSTKNGHILLPTCVHSPFDGVLRLNDGTWRNEIPQHRVTFGLDFPFNRTNIALDVESAEFAPIHHGQHTNDCLKISSTTNDHRTLRGPKSLSITKKALALARAFLSLNMDFGLKDRWTRR